MNLQVLSEVVPAEWDANVIRLNGNSFHSYKWIQFRTETNSSSPLFFCLIDNAKNICSIAFGFLATKDIAGRSVHTSLSFGSLPASENLDISRVMIERILDYSIENKIVALEISSFGTPFGNDILHQHGFRIQKKWEFVLNIDKTSDELWDQMDSTKRRSIRRGRKNGLVVKLAKSMDEVFQFRKLAVETYERKNKQGIDYPKAPPESYYKSLKSKLIDEGIGKLYLAYDKDEIVAAVFFVGFNKQAYYMLSSSSDIGLKKSAPDLIIWNSLIDFIDEGYSIFNLGGLSESELNGLPLEQAGLYRFKQKYSAEVVPACKGSIVLKTKTYRFISLYKSVKDLLTQSLINRQ